MNKVTLSLLLVISTWSIGQSKREKAHNLGMEAVKEIDAGNFQKAIDLLEEAEKLDPKDINYPYEIALAQYLQKDYKAAIKILKGLTSHKDVNPRVLQLLGNTYDMTGKTEKAVETYEEGLKSFPNAGELYLERGNIALNKKEYNEALRYYEKGIEMSPRFPSNYYWAAKLFMNSEEEVWGLIYGEIFMNLERNSKRTVEISALIYKTYQKAITISSDSTMGVSFCKTVMNINADSDPKNLKLPFCMIYEPSILMSLLSISEINIASLNTIRSGFIETYYKSEHDKNYPNVLFDYQRKLMDEEHFEAYNHWVLMKGDEKAFGAWANSNKEKWNNFLKWFSENTIVINDNRKFFRTQY